MTIQGHRSERIAEEIRNEVSLMLAGELKIRASRRRCS